MVSAATLMHADPYRQAETHTLCKKELGHVRLGPPDTHWYNRLIIQPEVRPTQSQAASQLCYRDMVSEFLHFSFQLT